MTAKYDCVFPLWSLLPIASCHHDKWYWKCSCSTCLLFQQSRLFPLQTNAIKDMEEYGKLLSSTDEILIPGDEISSNCVTGFCSGSHICLPSASRNHVIYQNIFPEIEYVIYCVRMWLVMQVPKICLLCGHFGIKRAPDPLIPFEWTSKPANMTNKVLCPLTVYW